MDSHYHGHSILVEGAESARSVARQLAEGLVAYNESHAGPRNTQEFTLSVRDAGGTLIGGLTAELFWNSMYVGILWVDESARGQGHGTALMLKAEAIARARSCEVAFLSTMTFQAPDFYRKLGYAPFGELADSPKGARRIWMAKRLTPVA